MWAQSSSLRGPSLTSPDLDVSRAPSNPPPPAKSHDVPQHDVRAMQGASRAFVSSGTRTHPAAPRRRHRARNANVEKHCDCFVPPHGAAASGEVKPRARLRRPGLEAFAIPQDALCRAPHGFSPANRVRNSESRCFQAAVSSTGRLTTTDGSRPCWTSRTARTSAAPLPAKH
jgi:hypothetical protein